ncbi:hypothetical protein C0Q70_17930 [Pomacea canaliculata]|uniref:C1q domain-containing protein n=1 Tax=Pomacea canaliculata TaxID=400727 RepID=A0A2T7NLU2_POMCA|nr:hypothetical protein C0Q70_17930 [Pomacea canaliculata]
MRLFQDGWTDQDGFINIDTQQDYKLKASFRDDDEMVLDFSRAFDTCDDKDYQFDNGTTHIIYFIGEGSPSGINDIQVPTLLHGVQRVQLLKPDWPDVKMPDDVTVIDITVPSIHVPSRETTYWWYVARLPSFRTKHHVIKYEAVIDKGHEGLVHHMELFHCEVPPGTQIPEFNGPGPGKGEEKPSRLSSCQQVLGAWAMGAKAMVYPEEAGIPVGGEHFSPFVLLEIHYNNPSRIPDLVDSSGMRFYVTSKLREDDAGLLQIGLEYTDKMAIPPHQKLFTLTGYCVPQCTRVVRGIASIWNHHLCVPAHSHLTGRRMRTKHIRFGVELPEVNRDDHYSPHFQEIRRLQHPVKVLPGDALITYCDDSTFDRDHVTTGGLSIQQEMCVNYVHYYPRVKLELCKSSVDTRTLNAFFNFMSVMENEETAADKTPSDNYEKISWTPLNVHLLKALYREAPLTVLCNRSDGTSFPCDTTVVTNGRTESVTPWSSRLGEDSEGLEPGTSESLAPSASQGSRSNVKVFARFWENEPKETRVSSTSDQATDISLNASSTTADEDEKEQLQLIRRRRDMNESSSFQVTRLAIAMKAIELENTQLKSTVKELQSATKNFATKEQESDFAFSQVNAALQQQQLAIGQLQLQVSQLSTNMMKLQDENEALRAKTCLRMEDTDSSQERMMKIFKPNDQLLNVVDLMAGLQSDNSSIYSQLQALSADVIQRGAQYEEQHTALQEKVRMLQTQTTNLDSNLSKRSSALEERLTSQVNQLQQKDQELVQMVIRRTSEDLIGFHARLSQNVAGATTETLKLDVVHFNGGGGYDSTTGIFTAPVTGLYLFMATIGGVGTSTAARIYIEVNGNPLTGCYSGLENDLELATCHGANRVLKGQRIRIVKEGSSTRQIWGGNWTTFTVVLIRREPERTNNQRGVKELGLVVRLHKSVLLL